MLPKVLTAVLVGVVSFMLLPLHTAGAQSRLRTSDPIFWFGVRRGCQADSILSIVIAQQLRLMGEEVLFASDLLPGTGACGEPQTCLAQLRGVCPLARGRSLGGEFRAQGEWQYLRLWYVGAERQDRIEKIWSRKVRGAPELAEWAIARAAVMLDEIVLADIRRQKLKPAAPDEGPPPGESSPEPPRRTTRESVVHLKARGPLGVPVGFILEALRQQLLRTGRTVAPLHPPLPLMVNAAFHEPWSPRTQRTLELVMKAPYVVEVRVRGASLPERTELAIDVRCSFCSQAIWAQRISLAAIELLDRCPDSEWEAEPQWSRATTPMWPEPAVWCGQESAAVAERPRAYPTNWLVACGPPSALARLPRTRLARRVAGGVLAGIGAASLGAAIALTALNARPGSVPCLSQSGDVIEPCISDFRSLYIGGYVTAAVTTTAAILLLTLPSGSAADVRAVSHPPGMLVPEPQ